MIKSLIALFVLAPLLTPVLAHAQDCNPACANQPAVCCNVPQADTFSALEPNTHDVPGAIFRGIMADNIPGSQCAVDSTITNLLQNIPQPGAVFETVDAPGLGGLIFAIKLKLKFAAITGALAGTDGTDPCFKLDVQHFTHPPSPIMFTDGCGTHVLSIGQPKYACVLGPPISRTLVCFAAKNADGPLPPLPPGFDRLEDFCALVDLVP
jgi:hypothetical protein